MPISKTKMKNAAIAAKMAALPSILKELVDQFVDGPMTGEAVNAATAAFKKALIERALGAEMSHHLGYANGASKPEAGGANQRNGKGANNKCAMTCKDRIQIFKHQLNGGGIFDPVLIKVGETKRGDWPLPGSNMEWV